MNPIESAGVGSRSFGATPYGTSAGSFLEIEMDTKYCPACETDVKISKFQDNYKWKDGLDGCCVPCRDEYHRGLNPKKAAKWEKTRKRRLLRGRARKAVAKAIRDGILIRPDRCSNPKCNCLCKPEGHHWSYLEERWLDVEWLCADCHHALHSIFGKSSEN